MSIRKFAAVALSASLMLGTAGCTFMTPIASNEVYAPSDGTQADLGAVKALNFLYLQNETASAIFGSLVNTDLKSHEVTIQFTDATLAEKKDVSFVLQPGQKLDLGYNGSSPVFADLGAPSGSTVLIYLIEGSENGVAINLPSLDPNQAEYKDLLSAFQPAGASDLTLEGGAAAIEPSEDAAVE